MEAGRAVAVVTEDDKPKKNQTKLRGRSPQANYTDPWRDILTALSAPRTHSVEI
jgi:hypothetical protein